MDRRKRGAIMSDMFDAIIVGGGHNGLTCGAYLSKAGYKVCVLEAKSQIGGAVVTEELWPGYHVSTASYLMGLLQPKVMLDLDLKAEGLEVLKMPPTFQPLGIDDAFVFYEDRARLKAEIARFSESDAAAYDGYVEHMTQLSASIRDMLWQVPIDPKTTGIADLLELARFASTNRKLVDNLYGVYDIMTLSSYDFLSRWFKSEDVKAVLGFYSSAAGGVTSMKTAGSAYILLRGFLRQNTTPAGGTGIIRGGMGSISNAIASAGKKAGMTIRTGAEVDEIVVSDNVARGVRLRDGSVVKARVVVSNAPAKITFLKLLKSTPLPPQVVTDVSNIRDKSTSYKVHLALSALPKFSKFDPEKAGFPFPVLTKIGPSVDYIERSFDGSKYGEYAQNPCLAVLVPSALDDTLSPPGCHVVSIFGSHAPYMLKTGPWTEADRRALYERTISVLERHAPGIRELIVHHQIMVAPDFEKVFRLPGGHVHHGELSADQIFFKRPIAHYADYRSPVTGLFQCGASTHPGGGVTGVPGHNAARCVGKYLKKLKR